MKSVYYAQTAMIIIINDDFHGKVFYGLVNIVIHTHTYNGDFFAHTLTAFGPAHGLRLSN